MFTFIAGIGAFIIGLGLFTTIGISLALILFGLINLTGEKENRVYIFWMILLGAFLWFKYQPDLLWTIGGILLSVLIGLIYSFYKWARECKKLRERLDTTVAEVTEWPAKIEPNLSKCVFSDIKYSGTSRSFSILFPSKEDVLKVYAPTIGDNRGIVALWIIFWFLYVLHAFTVKGIENLQDLCSGIYKRITAQHFSA